jgi:hypothetical protein
MLNVFPRLVNLIFAFFFEAPETFAANSGSAKPSFWKKPLFGRKMPFLSESRLSSIGDLRIFRRKRKKHRLWGFKLPPPERQQGASRSFSEKRTFSRRPGSKSPF